jgi:hypothetical protein
VDPYYTTAISHLNIWLQSLSTHVNTMEQTHPRQSNGYLAGQEMYFVKSEGLLPSTTDAATFFNRRRYHVEQKPLPRWTDATTVYNRRRYRVQQTPLPFSTHVAIVFNRLHYRVQQTSLSCSTDAATVLNRRHYRVQQTSPQGLSWTCRIHSTPCKWYLPVGFFGQYFVRTNISISTVRSARLSPLIPCIWSH